MELKIDPEAVNKLVAESELLATVQENGPWTVCDWGNGRIVLQSEDFNHDVTLKISGDFETESIKMAYAEEIYRRLNAMNPVANAGVTGAELAKRQR